MTQTTETNLQRIEPEDVRQQLTGKHVCPFCGVIRADQQQPCPRCTMEDTGATRSATRQRIGPWFVLQARNPSAPGMKFATLLTLVRKGHVTPRSIVRGPTTHQLWTFAARVRGISREFGLCWHCGDHVATAAVNCSHCDRKQEPPAEPDVLLEGAAPPPPAPELQVTANASPETGMDGGTSLDLQVDSAFSEPPRPAPRPQRAPLPSIASSLPASRPAPAPVPAASSSMAIVPSRNVSAAAKEEAILSARELAAAFQLDFKGPPGARAGRGGFFKTMVALILIAAVAVAIVMAIRPDVREKSFAWLGGKWESIKTSLEQPASNGNNGGAPKPNTIPKAGTPNVAPPKPEVPKPEPKVDPGIIVKPEPRPEPRPEVRPEVPAVTEVKPPPPPPVPPAAVEPRPVPPAPETAVPPETADANLTIPQATALASQLRNKGLDAEFQGRWADAVKLYEQIQRLPREAWPADTTQRLDRARRRMAAP